MIDSDVLLWTIIFLVTLGLIIIVFFIVFYTWKQKINGLLEKTISQNSKSYIYTIYFEKDLVVIFNRKRIKNKRKVFIKEFLSRFNSKDVSRITSWFETIEKSYSEAEKDIEVESSILNKKSNFVLLSAKQYNEKERVLYLEGTQLNHIYSSLGRKAASNKKHFQIKKAQIENVFNGLKNPKGYALLINFFKKNKDLASAEEIEKNILLRLKNEVYPFSKNGRRFRYIYNDHDNNMILFDFKSQKKDDAVLLARQISQVLGASIKMNGYSSFAGFSIGIVYCENYPHNFKALNDAAKEAAKISKDNASPYYVYELDTYVSQDVIIDKERIEKVFADKALSVSFRPIYSCKNKCITGYFSYIKCLDPYFDNYCALAKYTNKIDRNRELFHKYAQKCVEKFYSECKIAKARLFINASLLDIDFIGRVLNSIAFSEEINIVLMFEETEINANIYSQELMLAHLSELKSLGFEIALSLKDEDLLLDPALYGNFNYFVLGSAMVSKIRVSNRIKLSNMFLIEQLIQFKRPIIATDLDGWPSIELFIRSGCYLLSSNAISQANEMILPIEKKIIDKIENYLK